MKIACFALLILFSLTLCSAADEIMGRITEVNPSSETFKVSGITVAAGKARIKTEIGMEGNIDNLKSGDYVEIDGVFEGPASMSAEKVEKKFGGYGKIKGRIDSVNAGKGEIILNGVTVKVTPHTWLEGHGDNSIKIGYILPGERAECKGDWTGDREFTAKKVELD